MDPPDEEEGYSSQDENHEPDEDLDMGVDHYDDDDDDNYDEMEDEFEVALEDTINPLLIQDINIMREWWGTESIDFKIFEALDEMEVRIMQFLSRATRPISHRVGRSIGRSVCRSVGPVTACFFCAFELFEGRKVQI